VQDSQLIPVADYPRHLMDIPPSRMFLIREALRVYLQNNGTDAIIFDASQGDGGKSLPGVPPEILQRALALQLEHGTGYDKPYGFDGFREAVVNLYWKLRPELGWGPSNVLGGVGGRDVLMKAFQAMLFLGNGCVGDAILTSAVPWISYNWGPYAVGLNVLRAPGDSSSAWTITEDGLQAAVKFAAKSGRKIAGLIITSPDNPTGRTMSITDQISLARKALELGVEFVLFDWMYHWVTDGDPHDINTVLAAFSSDKRNRLMFLDGLTKSLGGSNIRNAHLLASQKVIDFIVSRASHGVFPDFFGQAVAMASYEMGYARAAAETIHTTAESRAALRSLLNEGEYHHIIGDGYYAFIDVEDFCAPGEDSEAIGEILAQRYGVAVVPGVHFSDAGRHWIRFSYAMPVERTRGAFQRMDAGLKARV
jgi:aspartate/methionine/tyrosine aminotransferase